MPLSNPKIKDLIFSGEPVYYPIEAYDNAIKRIKELSKTDSNVLSVYTFGEINCPGVSDLDLIFILKDTSKLPKFLKSVPKEKVFNYVIFHPFFIIDEHIMRNMNYLYPTSNFKLIYGKKIGIKALNPEDKKKSLIFLTTDVILRHLPGDYINPLLSGRINVRMCLLRLNSLSHSIGVFKNLNKIIPKKWQDYTQEVSKLRKDWFKISKKVRINELVKLLKKAVIISCEFTEKFEKLYIYNKRNEQILFKGVKNRISFVDHKNSEEVLDKVIKHFKRYKNYYSILPSFYVNQLNAYATFNGPLSNYIRKHLSNYKKVEKIDKVLKKRILLLNKQVIISNKLKHTHFPCFFPLGYKNTKGIINKLRYLAIIIINSSLFRRIIYPIRENTGLF